MLEAKVGERLCHILRSDALGHLCNSPFSLGLIGYAWPLASQVRQVSRHVLGRLARISVPRKLFSYVAARLFLFEMSLQFDEF